MTFVISNPFVKAKMGEKLRRNIRNRVLDCNNSGLLIAVFVCLY